MVDLELPFGIKPVNPVSVVATYGPWADVAEALTNIPIGIRHKGLTAAVQDGGETKEYWFKDGIANLDFILKSNSAGGGTGLPSYIVPITETVVVDQNKQHFTHGDLTVQGTFENNGKTVITEGILDLDGGIFDNNGLLELDDDNAGVGSAEQRYIEYTLTDAQIRSGNSSPIQIIPAPGIGKFIRVTKASYKYTYGGVPFADGVVNNTMVLTTKFPYSFNQSQQKGLQMFGVTSNFNRFGDFYDSAIGSGFGASAANALEENVGLYMVIDQSDLTGGNGSSMKLYISYEIVKL